MKDHINHILFQRHLLWEFLRRDLQARYIGSAMGFFWSVINPLILLVVYTFVFGIILKAKYEARGMQSGTWDFAFYIFCGLLPWYAFQESIVRSTTCIIDNSHLIKQVRFPAKILPAYLTLSSITNQLIGTAIFIVVLLFAGYASITWIAFLPVLVLEMILFVGLGLLLSTLNVYLRDIAPLVGISTMILMWAAPMLYPIYMVPDLFLPIIFANPITYLITIHHDLFIFSTWPSLEHWIILAALSLSFLGLGYSVFTRCHHEFADLV